MRNERLVRRAKGNDSLFLSTDPWPLSLKLFFPDSYTSSNQGVATISLLQRIQVIGEVFEGEDHRLFWLYGVNVIILGLLYADLTSKACGSHLLSGKCSNVL